MNKFPLNKKIVFLCVAIGVVWSIGLCSKRLNTLDKGLKNKMELIKPLVFTSDNIIKYDGVKRDEQGIPLLTLPNKREIYYPIQIFQIALTFYHDFYKNNHATSKEKFLELAQWAYDNFEDMGEWGGWFTYDRLQVYHYTLPSRWISAMSQGFGLSVMLEAYSITGDKRYSTLASKALQSFRIPVARGGILSSWNSEVFFEEYPSNPASHVLNGFIFSLTGLYDYYCVTGDLEAKELFDMGVKGLKKNLHHYDAHFTSYYSMLTINGKKSLASAMGSPPDHYHHLHIMQLLWLYKVTKDHFFRHYAELFLEYDMGAMEDLHIKNRIINVQTQYSMTPDEDGPNNLINSNWTFGPYWSTNIFPCDIVFEFDKPVENLHKLFLIATSESMLPVTFCFHVYQNDKWRDVTQHVRESRDELFTNTTRHYVAVVKSYTIHPPTAARKIKIQFHKNDAGLIALREINFLYDKNHILENLEKRVTPFLCK